jgi:hypothetical protein
VPRGAARYTIGRPIPRTTSSCDSAVIERTRRRRLTHVCCLRTVRLVCSPHLREAKVSLQFQNQVI